MPVNKEFGLSTVTRKRELVSRALEAPQVPPAFFLDPARLKLAAQNSELKPKEERAAPQEPTAENNRIGRRLIYLLHGASLNVLRRTDKHPAQFRSLLEFCKQVPTPNGGSLYNLIQARPRAFENGFLLNCAREAANEGLGATCWWICPIEDFNPDRGVFLANDEDIEVFAPVPGHIRFFGGKIESVVTRFPALMLARCDETGILDAYAHPILSVDRWCPVDSHLERSVINEIRGLLPALCDEYGIEVHITKPVYNWLNTGERPDIVLTTMLGSVEHHLVVEVMGFTDEKYVSRKAQLRQCILSVPHASYCEDRRAINGNQAADHIEVAISAWLRELSQNR